MSDETVPAVASDWKARAKSIGDIIARSESPIEAILLVALFADMSEFSTPAQPVTKWYVSNQTSITTERGDYRVDIEIIGEGVQAVIETDGHDFHERTPEQVASDNERERAIEAAGWHVIRFSGREVSRDPMLCVSEIKTLLSRWRSEVGNGDPLEQAIIAFTVANNAEWRWGYAKNRRPSE